MSSSATYGRIGTSLSDLEVVGITMTGRTCSPSWANFDVQIWNEGNTASGDYTLVSYGVRRLR